MTARTMDRERWARLSIVEQMGNIYIEVERSLAAHRAGDRARFEDALVRTLDLFEATVACTLADRPHRAREILRAKDQYLQLFFGDLQDADSTASLERYFWNFALASRRDR